VVFPGGTTCLVTDRGAAVEVSRGRSSGCVDHEGLNRKIMFDTGASILWWCRNVLHIG